MIRHIPYNTRIFIGLVIITLLLTYLAISLSVTYQQQVGSGVIIQKLGKQGAVATTSAKETPVDTSKWVTYTDKNYPISFNHPSAWTISSKETDSDLYTIAVNVTGSNQDIKIYINKTGYLGFDGLNEKPYTVGSAQGIIVNGGLIGLRAGEYYYTFDASMNPELENEFKALVKTVKFD